MVINSPSAGPKCSHIKAKSWTLNCLKKPVIGVSVDASEGLMNTLQQEGFVWERCLKPDQVSCYIDYNGIIDSQVKQRLMQAILDCGEPILQFSRWPNGAACAVSITGDIDGVDFWDFWRRFHG